MKHRNIRKTHVEGEDHGHHEYSSYSEYRHRSYCDDSIYLGVRQKRQVIAQYIDGDGGKHKRTEPPRPANRDARVSSKDAGRNGHLDERCRDLVLRSVMHRSYSHSFM
jgi:hypothetical protein